MATRMELVKKYVRCGLFNEARKIIESTTTTANNASSQHQDELLSSSPLLIMLALIREEPEALGLSRLLLEKGYPLNATDSNGLCALNYAIALNKLSLVRLFLSTFNFDLNLHRDKYKNTLLHYVFANASPEMIDAFKLVYSKYYEWNPDKFKTMVNCDHLSVGDLYEYVKNMTTTSGQQENNSTQLDKMSSPRSWDTSASSFVMANLPESFRIDSSPIVICKYINKVYNSNSTLKSEILFVQNNKLDRNKSFKLNLLYLIKDMNRVRVRPDTLSSKSLGEFGLMRRRVATAKARLDSSADHSSSSSASASSSGVSNSEEYHHCRPKTAKGPRVNPSMKTRACNDISVQSFVSTSTKLPSANWRNDFKHIYREFSIVNSPSYRVSSAVHPRIHTSSGDHHASSHSLNPSEFTAVSGSIKSSYTLSTVHEGVSTRGVHKSTSQYLTVPSHENSTSNSNTHTVKHSKTSVMGGPINSTKLDAYLAGASSRHVTRRQ